MRYPTPGEVGAATALATIGALPLGNVTDVPDASPAAYAVGSIGGAAVGGGLVGFVAAGDAYGAVTGSLLTTGLTGLATAFAILRRERTGLGVALALGGLFSVGSAIWMSGRRR